MVPSVAHTSANAASSNPEASLASLKRRGRIKAIYILALVSSISLLCYYDRFVVAIVAQSIKADLHVSDGEIDSACCHQATGVKSHQPILSREFS